jgi:hypothetical protein
MAQNEWAVVSETPIARTAGTGWEVVEQKPTTGAFAAGVKSYLPQVQETFGGLKTLLGVGAERVLGEGQISRGLIESGAASMKEAEAKRQPFMTAERGSFTDALNKGVGTVLTEWLPYQAGSGAAQLVEALALVGAGGLAGTMTAPGPGTLAGAGTGLVARELAKRGVKEAAEKILKERGEDAAKVYFEKAAKDVALDIGKKRGQTAALAGQAAFYGTGQTTSRAVEEAEKLGGTATDIELARVLPAAAVSTVAEFIGDKIALGALKGLKPGEPGKFVATDLAKNILLNIGLTGTKEVPVEVIQSAAERFGAKLSLTDAQALKEYIDATAASYGMAVAPGVGGGVRQTMTERELAKDKREQAEIETLQKEVNDKLEQLQFNPPTVAPEGAAPPVTEEPVTPPAAPPAGPTPEELARIQDEHETAIIEGLIAQDVEMARAKQLAEQRAQEQSEAEFLESGIKETDRRVREGRIFARVQDLIDRNIPFASTAINDINQKFGVINEAPLTEEERARVENIMGMVSTFTNFVNLPVLAPKPMDPFAENQQMEALIRERTERGQAQPIRTAPAAPSPSVQETPVSQRVGEGPALRPPSGVEPSVAEDSELVTPAPVVEAAAPVEPPSRNSEAWRTEGKTPEQLMADKVESVSSELAAQIADEASAQDFSPNELPTAIQQWASDAKIPADDLRLSVIKALDKFDISDARKAQVKKALSPLRAAPAAPTVEAAAPKAETPTAKPAKAAAIRKQPNTVMGSTMLADVSNRLGGLDLSLLSEFSTKFITKRKDKYGRPLTMWRNPMVPGVGTLFRKGGESDYVLIATMLEEAGYLEPGSVESDYKEAGERAKDMIKAALNREEVLTLEQQESQRQTDEEANRQAWLEQQEELKAERDNAAREAGLTPYEGDLLTDEDIDVFAPAKPQTDEQYAAGMRGLGFDETEIADAVQKKQERERAQKTASGRPAKARTVPETGENTEGLERYTAEEVTRKQEEAEKAAAEEKKAKAAEQARLQKEQREKEEKARADESSKDFELGKSAEEQMTGMGDLFKGEKKSLGGERAQVQAREDQEPDNFLYSVEPTIKSDRLPSYKRGVENLRKRWDKGEITAEEFANRVDMLARQIESAEYQKEFGNQFKGRERGADFIRQRLLEAKRRGDLSEEAVDFAEWFILRNPALVDDLGISIRKPKEDGVGGMYSEMARVMYLMKERGNDQTIVHEILHHLERMMPKDVQTAIRKNWIKSLMEAQKTAKSDAEKTFFANLIDYHFANGPRSKLNAAIEAIKNGDVEPSFYQYTSPSEFWAVNGSEIMQSRFDVKGALLQRLRRWLSELKEKARDLFGLNSTAPIIRALDSLSKGDGKFVTSTLLDETTEPKLSVTQQGTPGEQAISIVNSLGMGVKPPEPGRFEKAKKILKDAGENPSLTKESAKKTLTKWLDWFETTVFSSDSAFNNKIRRGIISDFKQNPEVLGMLLEASQSQTVHADALASQFMIDGGLQYNEELKKWESIKKDDNFVALAKKIEDLATKYNVTKDEMERIAHTYFVAKRLPGIIKRNEELDADIAAERATAKPDRKQIEEWESLKVFVSDEQLAMMEPGLSLVKTIPELKEVVDIWQGIRKNNIEVMVNSGLWSPEYATAMWDNMDYVPYYREEQLEEGAGPQEFIRGLQVKSKEFQLKGSGAAVNDVFDNMIRWSQYAMNRAIRAHKATQMIDAALKIEVDGKPMATKVTEQKRGMNIVRAFRDGKQELYDMADPLFVPAFSAIQNVSIPTLTFMSKLANVLRQSVVLYPLFSVAQVPQDSFAAMFSSGLKTQHALKIPYLAVKEFIKTLSKTSQTHNELKRFGVVGVRDFSATVIRDDAEIYAGLRPPKGGWGKTKEFLEHIAMAADNAVRQAVYEASMQQGLNKSEALEKAFEIINFRRRGTSKMLNVMGQTVPFFYAYLSAQRVAYRVLSGVGISPSDRKEALTTLATTSAAVAALSMLYAMSNGDDEDYAETPAAIRDRTLTIPGSGGVRIPLRPDFFLFPKIVAEHTYLMLSDKGYEDGAKFRKSMADALLSAVASPTPFPTAIKPAIEVAINYDFFQGKPLIGNFEKQKDVERQFRDSTSEFAKLLGETGVISPIAVDHLIRGMLGSFGGLFLFGTNQFLHSDPDVPRPEMSANEMLAALPGTSGLLKRPQESALKNDFFVLRDEVEKAANTFNDIKTRSPEGIQAFLEDEKNAIRLGMAKGVDKINRHLSDIRRRMTIITNMPESQMPADEKAENIRELRELEREILRSVNVKELREMAKI